MTDKLNGSLTIWTIVPNPPNPFNIAAFRRESFSGSAGLRIMIVQSV